MKKLNLNDQTREKKMKYLLSITAIFLMFFIGCSKDVNINSPIEDQVEQPNWIVSLSLNDLAVNTIHSASVLIDGAKGGDVQIRKDVPGGPFGKVHIDSRLHINSGSFVGKMTISTYVDDAGFLTTFGPSYVFSKPLVYTLLLQGLDLSGVNPANVKFVYQAANGSIYQCQYSSIDVDLTRGKLKVNSALIPHFSRYGFINKDE